MASECGADLIALISAARGRQQRVTAEHQDQLEEIYAFFEKARKTTAPTGGAFGGAFGAPRPAPVKSSFTLANRDQVEWFVPYTARRSGSGGHCGWVWQFESSSDKEDREKVAILYRHVESLYRLGIPTFFRQHHPRFGQTKLLTSLEAHVRDECVPPETDQLARSAFWSSLQKGVARFVVPAIAKAVLKHFGPAHTTNQVAVFDATGFSPASCRWKLSMRINFVELAVNSETARQLRLSVIQVLDEEWRDFPRDSGWAAALEPINHADDEGAPEPSNDLDAGAGADPKFWEHMLDERIFRQGHQHRLVWCDAMQGDLPEGRPLLPFELLSVEAEASSGNVTVEQVRPEAPWGVLGSAAPLEPHVQVAAQHDQQGQQGHVTASPTGPLPDDWVLFLTETGRPYYHSNSRNETVWELPAPTSAEFVSPF